MAILIKLDIVLIMRKTSLRKLAETTNFSVSNLSRLKTGKARGIRFNTLNLICKKLNCQPGDILEFVNE